MTQNQETQISIKLSNSDKEIIKIAADLLGLGISSFCRMTSLEKAHELIQKNSIQKSSVHHKSSPDSLDTLNDTIA